MKLIKAMTFNSLEKTLHHFTLICLLIKFGKFQVNSSVTFFTVMLGELLVAQKKGPFLSHFHQTKLIKAMIFNSLEKTLHHFTLICLFIKFGKFQVNSSVTFFTVMLGDLLVARKKWPLLSHFHQTNIMIAMIFSSLEKNSPSTFYLNLSFG